MRALRYGPRQARNGGEGKMQYYASWTASTVVYSPRETGKQLTPIEDAARTIQPSKGCQAWGQNYLTQPEKF